MSTNSESSPTSTSSSGNDSKGNPGTKKDGPAQNPRSSPTISLKDQVAARKYIAASDVSNSSNLKPSYGRGKWDDYRQLSFTFENSKSNVDRIPSTPHANKVENSIERGMPKVASNAQFPGQSANLEQSAPIQESSKKGIARRIRTSIGEAAVNVGTWLKEGTSFRLAHSDRSAMDVPTNAPQVKSAVDPQTIIPEIVTKKYLKVEKDFYFPDRSPAFSDHGNKLVTRGAHPDVIRSLVEIAVARGWDSIVVKGTDEFRRKAWLEAAHQGLQVAGYKPSGLDLAEAARRPAGNSLEEREVKAEHLPSPSAPVKEKSGSAKSVGAETNMAEASPESKKKAKAFSENKPTYVVKKYPELAGAYGLVEAARIFAAEKLPEGAQEEFVGIARRHILERIMAGETVKGPKIYLNQTAQRQTNSQSNTPDRKADSPQRPPQSKEVARER